MSLQEAEADINYNEEEEDLVTKKTWQEKFADFFQESREPTVNIKTPEWCHKLSKGVVLGIMSMFFIAIIIVWVIFSTENYEEEEKLLELMGRRLCPFSANNCTNSTLSGEMPPAGSYNIWFILCATVFIVMIILTGVFMCAAGKYYYQKSKKTTEAQCFRAFIFGEQNKRDHLFYLEQNERMHTDQSHECCKNSFYGVDSKVNFYGILYRETSADIRAALLNNHARRTSKPFTNSRNVSISGSKRQSTVINTPIQLNVI